jgi:membrane protease YdiL (CAAX protease family)
VVEEAAFRGYLQRGIERRHGPAAAILVTGLLFGLAHFTHPEVTVALLPYYLAVAAVYGALAWLTDSILPGLVLHAGGNLFLSVAQVLGRSGAPSEWQAPATPAPLVWETGADAAFWGAVAGTVVVGAAAVGAFAALASITRRARVAVVA